jgi:hypothetical protein
VHEIAFSFYKTNVSSFLAKVYHENGPVKRAIFSRMMMPLKMGRKFPSLLAKMDRRIEGKCYPEPRYRTDLAHFPVWTGAKSGTLTIRIYNY